MLPLLPFADDDDVVGDADEAGSVSGTPLGIRQPL